MWSRYKPNKNLRPKSFSWTPLASRCYGAQEWDGIFQIGFLVVESALLKMNWESNYALETSKTIAEKLQSRHLKLKVDRWVVPETSEFMKFILEIQFKDEEKTLNPPFTDAWKDYKEKSAGPKLKGYWNFNSTSWWLAEIPYFWPNFTFRIRGNLQWFSGKQVIDQRHFERTG